MSDSLASTPLAPPPTTAAPLGGGLRADAAVHPSQPFVAAANSSEVQEAVQAPIAPSSVLASQADMLSPGPAIATAASAAVPTGAPAPSAIAAALPSDYAKSLGSPSPIKAPQPQAQAAACRDGGERGQKQFATPPAAPIASPQGELLLAAASRDQPSSVLGRTVTSHEDTAMDVSAAASLSGAASAASLSLARSSPSAAATAPFVAAVSHSASHAALAPRAGNYIASTTSLDRVGQISSLQVGGSASAAYSGPPLASTAGAPQLVPSSAGAGGASFDASAAPQQLRQRPVVVLHGAAASGSSAAGAQPSAPRPLTDFERMLSAERAKVRAQHQARPLTAAQGAGDGDDEMKEALEASPDAASSGRGEGAISLKAQCLVVDTSRFQAGGSDQQQLDTVKAAAHINDTLGIAALLAWLPQLKACQVAGITTPSATAFLHIEFRTRVGLVAAQGAVHFLVPCCVLHVQSGSAWPRARLPPPCGLPRQDLPEKLHLSCGPCPNLQSQDTLAVAVKALLMESSFEYVVWWNKPLRPGKPVNVSVLARLADRQQLQAAINRMHHVVKLDGQLVSVDAPNTPALRRCNLCRSLGHVDKACTKYDCQFAIRLLCKNALNDARLKLIADALGADDSFVGCEFNSRESSRVGTLLFGQREPLSTDRQAALAAALVTLEDDQSDALFEAPRPLFDLRQTRTRQCTGCGHVPDAQHPHVCPFPVPGLGAGRGQMAPQQRMAAGVAASPGTARHVTSLPDGVDMCPEWLRFKTCRRHVSNQTCCQGAASHPADWVPYGLCRDFVRGTCERRTCKFKHLMPGRPQSPAASSAAKPAHAGAAAATPVAIVATAQPPVSVVAATPAAVTAAVPVPRVVAGREAEERKDQAESQHLAQSASDESKEQIKAPLDALPTSAASLVPSHPESGAPMTTVSRGKGSRGKSGPKASSGAAASSSAAVSSRSLSVSTSNAFSQLAPSDDPEAAESQTPPPPARAPPSSLSSLPSPNKETTPAAKKRGRDPSQAAAAGQGAVGSSHASPVRSASKDNAKRGRISKAASNAAPSSSTGPAAAAPAAAASSSAVDSTMRDSSPPPREAGSTASR